MCLGCLTKSNIGWCTVVGHKARQTNRYHKGVGSAVGFNPLALGTWGTYPYIRQVFIIIIFPFNVSYQLIFIYLLTSASIMVIY